MKNPRGQAVVELALGVLVLVPMLLMAFYLLEAASEKLVATRAGTEALWATTAYSHHTYASASFHSPSAAAAAQAVTAARYAPKSRLFVAEKGISVSCAGAGQGIAHPVAATASFYQDLGGARCAAQLSLEARFLPTGFADQGPGSFFQEPLSKLRRAFTFCETETCSGFPMLVDDWGLTADNGEAQECPTAMELTGGCTNKGYFLAGKTVYEAHRTAGGTLSNADTVFVQRLFNTVPNDLAETKEFQMSFRGEESAFSENVDVIEGRPDWDTTPYVDGWKASHELRSEDFLGR